MPSYRVFTVTVWGGIKLSENWEKSDPPSPTTQSKDTHPSPMEKRGNRRNTEVFLLQRASFSGERGNIYRCRESAGKGKTIKGGDKVGAALLTVGEENPRFCGQGISPKR